jgi:hypothetical protein
MPIMHTRTVFVMNSSGEVVGCERVGQDELVQLIDKLLDSDDDSNNDDDSKIVTYLEVHDGSCSVRP